MIFGGTPNGIFSGIADYLMLYLIEGRMAVAGSYRIATWNLERPRTSAAAKNNQRLRQLALVNADLFFLTESHAAIAIDRCQSVCSRPIAAYHRDGEHMSSVWSRWPILEDVPTFDATYAAAALVDSPFGPMLAYSTVIVYAHVGVREQGLRLWQAHRASVRAHAADWKRLRTKYPQCEFCVAGDFNQSRDQIGRYKDPESVQLLSEALKECELECISEMDMKKDFGLSRSSVDHICLSEGLRRRMIGVGAWEGNTLSDHNGVYVDLNEGQQVVPSDGLALLGRR